MYIVFFRFLYEIKIKHSKMIEHFLMKYLKKENCFLLSSSYIKHNDEVVQ